MKKATCFQAKRGGSTSRFGGCLASPPAHTRCRTSCEQHGSALARQQRWREVGVGAQILRDLGIRSIALITTSDRQYVGLGGFGIEITRTIRI